MCVRVNAGKGGADRYSMLSPTPAGNCCACTAAPTRRSATLANGCLPTHMARGAGRATSMQRAYQRAPHAASPRWAAPTPCATALPPTCSKAAWTCTPSAACLGHGHISTTRRYLHLISPQFRPPRTSTRWTCWPACRAVARTRHPAKPMATWRGRGCAALARRICSEHPRPVHVPRPKPGGASLPAARGTGWAATGCDIPAATATGNTTRAATGIARSAARAPRTPGCRAGWPRSCQCPMRTWCSRLPHSLNALYGAHPRWVIDTLFACTAQTLSEFAANPRWMGVLGAHRPSVWCCTPGRRTCAPHPCACGDGLRSWLKTVKGRAVAALPSAQAGLPVPGAGAVQGVSGQVSGGAGASSQDRARSNMTRKARMPGLA
jgi:hypothetical protein